MGHLSLLQSDSRMEIATRRFLTLKRDKPGAVFHAGEGTPPFGSLPSLIKKKLSSSMISPKDCNLGLGIA